MYALWYFSPKLKLMQTQVLALVISTRGSWNDDDGGHYFPTPADMIFRVHRWILGYVLYEKDIWF